MIIPDRGVEEFVAEISRLCTSDRLDRIQKSAFFRNLYLVGDENGDAQTFNKTFDAIEDLTSYLCSSVDLRFKVKFRHGGSKVDRAKGAAVAEELLDQSRACDLDTQYEEATRWSLVVGKTFIKHLWSVNGLEPILVMPEFMGVLRPDLTKLDDQEAFTHSSYVTRDQFRMIIKDHPDRERLYKRAMAFAAQTKSADAPDQAALLKQVILGGFQPYQGVGGVGSAAPQTTNGMVQWLAGPYPSFDPKVITDLIRIDEVWIKDDARTDDEGRREWTTMQMVGNILIFGREQHMNIWADPLDPQNVAVVRTPQDGNPLSFKQPFVEFCPNQLQGYFWGRSEIANLALLQSSVNKRINGINRLLRLQEDPPGWFQGGTAMTQQKKSKLTKPGGWLYEPDITAKPPVMLAPQLPTGLYDSLQESERMFDVMTGMTPTLQGMASGSLRSAGQTDQMTRNATPRFKQKAIRVERAIQRSAGLVTDLLRAKSIETLVGWYMPGSTPLDAVGVPDDPSLVPPAEGMKPIQFKMHDLPETIRVVVDSHSASPAFGDEAMQKAVVLKKAGVITPTEFIEMVNPQNVDEIIADAQSAEIKAAIAQIAAAKAQQQAAQEQAQQEAQHQQGAGAKPKLVTKQ
jgi:hypothetical protein